jgi:KipI family sensor histidine kinase inhibitor
MGSILRLRYRKLPSGRNINLQPCDRGAGGHVRIRKVGADALLIEVQTPLAWFDELWRRRASGEVSVDEIVPGATTVLLDGVPDTSRVIELLSTLSPDGTPTRDEAREPVTVTLTVTVTVPVVYDGEDLATVAALWGTDERGVVDVLTRTPLRVAFCGFAPGWAYLTGLPDRLSVPRLETPRTRVPAGSVALAGAYAGIYPSASPGGWRIVGHTDLRLFDPERDPPALLTPGARVLLVEVVPR